MLDMLSKALSELTDEERLLIDELFYNSKSERQVAKETGIPQTTLNYQKNKIIKRLRKKLNLE